MWNSTGHTVSQLPVHLQSVPVPPSYKWAKYSTDPAAKIQAVGIDGTGRVQYFYSAEHVSKSSMRKYCRMLNFGYFVPMMRKELQHVSRAKGIIGREGVMWLVFYLMYHCRFRVGTESTKDEYDTTGVTTMEVNNLHFHGDKLDISFIGKKKQINECTITDAVIVRKFRQLIQNKRANDRVFTYLNTKNESTNMEHDEVLQYFNEKYDISPKEIRTWSANIMLLDQWITAASTDSLKQIVENVATAMHHTPAICKKNYILADMLRVIQNKPEWWAKYQQKATAYYQRKSQINQQYTLAEWLFLGFVKLYCKKQRVPSATK